MTNRILLVLLALVLTSCTWGRFDRRHTYLEARSIPKVKIPAGLDKPDFEDVMAIPPVDDPRDIAGKPLTVGLPESFVSSAGVDRIVIKKLGDEHWVFLDAPPATVWPKVREYWEDIHVPLASADPSEGVMVTQWAFAKKGDPKAIFQSIKNGVTEQDEGVDRREKFRLRIEPGIRAGSTEIYLKQRSAPIGGPVRVTHVDWTGKSDNTDLEGVVLTDIAYYLGDHINTTYAVSKGAENIGGQKAQLYPDRVKPLLTYRLPFDRAWATVGQALQAAKIKVVDLDRSAANYYINFNPEHKGKPGFLSRLLFHGSSEVSDSPQNRFVVHLKDENGKGVNVTIMKDPKTLADADVAEKLLKIIKENST